MTLDTLTFARRLKSAGFPAEQAEALADINRDMLAEEVASKADIQGLSSDNAELRKDVRTEIGKVNDKVDQTRKDLNDKIDQTRKDLLAEIGKVNDKVDQTRKDLNDKVDQTRKDLNDKIDQTRTHLEAAIDASAMKVTIRFGVMMGSAIAILAAVLRLH